MIKSNRRFSIFSTKNSTITQVSAGIFAFPRISRTVFQSAGFGGPIQLSIGIAIGKELDSRRLPTQCIFRLGLCDRAIRRHFPSRIPPVDRRNDIRRRSIFEMCQSNQLYRSRNVSAANLLGQSVVQEGHGSPWHASIWPTISIFSCSKQVTLYHKHMALTRSMN